MIVNYSEKGWHVTYQPSHGLLAGQIAAQIRENLRPCYWIQTLAAVIQHDDFKTDFSGSKYVTEAGGPKDFTNVEIDDDERYNENRRRLEQAYKKHRWMGLLQSKHIETLYENEQVDQRLADMIEQERTHRQEVLEQLDKTTAELEYAYQLLHWCDRCSLILAQNNLPAMNRRLEILHALTDERYEIMQRDDKTLLVDPWPFGSEEFTVEVETRLLPLEPLAEDSELEQALLVAETETRSWCFRRAD